MAAGDGPGDSSLSTTTKKGSPTKKIVSTTRKVPTRTTPKRSTTTIKKRATKTTTRAAKSNAKVRKSTPMPIITSTLLNCTEGASTSTTPFDYPDIVDNATLPEGMFEVDIIGNGTDSDENDDNNGALVDPPKNQSLLSPLITSSIGTSPSVKSVTKAGKKSETTTTPRSRKTTMVKGKKMTTRLSRTTKRSSTTKNGKLVTEKANH